MASLIEFMDGGVTRSIVEITEAETGNYEFLHEAAGANIFHCMVLIVNHNDKNFKEKVVAFLKLDPDKTWMMKGFPAGMEPKVAYAFYGKKAQSEPEIPPSGECCGGNCHCAK